MVGTHGCEMSVVQVAIEPAVIAQVPVPQAVSQVVVLRPQPGKEVRLEPSLLRHRAQLAVDLGQTRSVVEDEIEKVLLADAALLLLKQL